MSARHTPLTVSVVIPVKDDDEELARCLSALARQTSAPDEIIVVDNGSTDDSASVARAGGAHVIPCGIRGIPAASARGYDAATGDVILRLDADSVPAPTWVATMRQAFTARPNVSVFAGGAYFIDGPRMLRIPLAATYLGLYGAVLTPTLGHLPLFGSNLGFRRVAWERIRDDVHRYDHKVHDDLDLAYHFGESHRIRYLPEAAMGISMRPFGRGRGFARRIHRGARTVTIHWPGDFPPVRWVRLGLRRALHRAGLRPPRSRAR